MAEAGVRVVHVASSVCAFGVLLGGLMALAVYPVVGVLVTLGGMALLLYAAAGLCGTSIRKP